MGILASIVLAFALTEGEIQPWADDHGYRAITFEADRVTLYVHASPKIKQDKLESRYAPRMQKTLDFLEQILPSNDATAIPSSPRPSDARREPRDLRPAEHKRLRGDDSSARRDPETKIVTTSEDPLEIIEIQDLEHARSLREFIAAQHPWFRVGSDADLVGFVISQPRLGAWVREVPGQEEWNADNELVNRLAQTVVHRRLGQLPFWLEQGLAWTVENEVEGSIYCFPFRAEFVYASEHRNWDRRLRAELRKTRDREIDFASLVAWSRGSFDKEASLLAWGVVDHLARRESASLHAIAKELAERHEKQRWQKMPDGSERTDPNYELPLEDQLEVFRKHLGEDFLASLGSELRSKR